MEKKRRRRQGEPGVHTAVVLPREMLDQLRASGRERGRGVSEEIRERLAGSLLEDAADQKTRTLVAEMSQLAEEVRLDFGTPWHADMNAHAALVAAMDDQLASHKPKEVSAAVPALFGPANINDPPEVIGRALARKYRREKQEIDASRNAYSPRSSKEQEND
jgi:hypothetical protein